MRVHASDASVGLSSHFGSPMHGSAPLAGRSGVTDVSIGLFNLYPTSWTCRRAICVPGQLLSPSVPSRHGFVPLASKSCICGSVGHVLTCLCVFSAVFACIATPWVSICMFGVPARLLGLAWPCLPALTGKFCICGTFQHVLMLSVVSAVVSVPLQMSGTSLCPLDTSDWLAWPSGPTLSQLAPPASDLAPVPPPLPIAAVSWVFNTVEASA